jgi:uncharacterized membrane protein HdeD (DUF308 family)
MSNVLLGVLFLVAGILIFLRSYQYDKNTMTGLKFRAIITSILSVIAGLVIIFS